MNYGFAVGIPPDAMEGITLKLVFLQILWRELRLCGQYFSRCYGENYINVVDIPSPDTEGITAMVGIPSDAMEGITDLWLVFLLMLWIELLLRSWYSSWCYGANYCIVIGSDAI